jgi:hypothetical protein
MNLKRIGYLMLSGAAMAVILSGCGSKKGVEETAMPADIECICVMPARVMSSEPPLEEAEMKSIGLLVQSEISSALMETIPDDVRLVRVYEDTDTDQCDALLSADIVFLQLVETKDTAAAAAATTAGVALMAVTGIGFFSVPAARMSVNLALTDCDDNTVLWKTMHQLSAASLSIGENYRGQVRSMTDQLKYRVKNQFPIRK